MNTAQSRFTEDDQSLQAGEPGDFIAAVSLETSRGPVGLRTDLIISSTEQFAKYYGQTQSTRDDELLAARMLDGSCRLRVNRIVHYTNLANNTYDAVVASINATNGALTATVTGTATSGNYTMAATGFTSAVVPFNTSHAQTFKDAIAKFYAVNSDKLINFALYPGSTTQIYAAPKYGYTLASLGYTGTGITATTVTQIDDISNANNEELFQLTPIGPGAGYNSMVYAIEPPSNGAVGYFNLRVYLQTESASSEVYDNLKIEGKLPISGLHFLDGLNKSSYLVKGTYLNLASISNAIVPQYGYRVLSGGTDGSATNDADYVGDSAAKNGFYAFDPIDDAYIISAPAKSSDAIHIAGFSYAANRQDVFYEAHLSNSYTTETALVAAKAALNVDTTYGEFCAGGVSVLDPITSLPRSIPETADIIAGWARSFNNGTYHKSVANSNRGSLYNVLGIVNNFGSRGNTKGLNLLANNQINVVIARDSKLMRWGNFTAQLATSKRSFSNIRMWLLYLKKSLGPLVESYLEEDCLPVTWKKMYMKIEPFMDDEASKGAVTGPEGDGWKYQGDQFAKNLDSLVVNNKADVALGKYKARLFVSPTPALRDIEIIITIMGSNISFEEALDLAI